jgi:xanthine dehydrogenase YagS FAD-binding subunit
MKAFTYRVASSEENACKILGEKAEKSLPLAGGTSLINLMKNYVLQPEVLVNIKKIPGTDKVEATDAALKLGANVLIADIFHNETIVKNYPALAQAARGVGTPQIRHQATLGGNLCQRPYCWYFTQEAFECLKKGGTACPAKDGENEFHAIFETDSPCVIAHPSSLAPALVALGAKVRIASPAGAREVPVEEFFVSPKTNARKENVLAPNEIVTHVLLGPGNPKSATYEVRQRESTDWPVCLASVSLDLEAGGNVKDSRICLGGVAPVPWRAKGAEAALKGKAVTPEAAQAAADAAVQGAAPLSQNAYKVRTAQAAVKRAILLAATGKWS